MQEISEVCWTYIICTHSWRNDQTIHITSAFSLMRLSTRNMHQDTQSVWHLFRMLMCDVKHTSKVFFVVFFLMKVHIMVDLIAFRGRRCLHEWICICVCVCVCVCVCADWKVWVIQIVQKQQLRSFSSSKWLWRLRWQTKEKQDSQTFHFRIKRAAWSLIWWSYIQLGGCTLKYINQECLPHRDL